MATRMKGPTAAHGVQSASDYASAHARAVGARVHDGAEAVEAYVSCGRWVCDCPECFNGPSVSVEWGVARCFECGAVYTVEAGTLRLPTPKRVADVEAVLAVRRRDDARNWRPSESVAALRRENAAHADEVAG